MSQRRHLRTPVAVGVLTVAGLAIGLTASSTGASNRAGSPPDTAPTGVYELPGDVIDTLRTAAAGLAGPEDALATGRSELNCIDHAGHHFANPTKLADGVLEPVDPEALVYADVDGTRRLVAVAWMSTAPGEVLGVPLHLDHDRDTWVLNAWIGLDNPAGMLADHHPDIGPCSTDPPASVPEPSTPSNPPTLESTTPETTPEPNPTSTPPPPDPTAPTSDDTDVLTLVVSGTFHGFGTVPVGKHTTRTTVISNPRADPVAIDVDIGVPPGPFRSHATNCGGTLAAGDECVVGFKFEPSSPGEYAEVASLTVTVDGQQLTFEVSLHGIGVPASTASTTTTTTLDIPSPTLPDFDPRPDPDPGAGSAA